MILQQVQGTAIHLHDFLKHQELSKHQRKK